MKQKRPQTTKELAEECKKSVAKQIFEEICLIEYDDSGFVEFNKIMKLKQKWLKKN